MPSSVPTPVAAALGMVPTVLGGVRRLPGKAVQLPILALSSALTGIDNARREYDTLAGRGERLLARLRGSSFDEIEDAVEDALQGTPFATPYDKVEDTLEDATDTVASLVRTAPTKARKAAGAAARGAGVAAKGAGDRVDRAADSVEDLSAAVTGAADSVAGVPGTVADQVEEVADDEEPKGKPTPKATQPDATRLDTAAAPDVVQTVEQISLQIGAAVLPHDELPLPDYDHLTLGSLRGRMRSLDLPQLVAVREYEKAHADRLPIVTMLDNRIAKLASDPTAPLSGGGGDPASTTSAPATPAAGPPTVNASKVSPATAAPKQPTASRGGLGDQNRLR